MVADAQTLQEENLSEKGSVESARRLAMVFCRIADTGGVILCHNSQEEIITGELNLPNMTFKNVSKTSSSPHLTTKQYAKISKYPKIYQSSPNNNVCILKSIKEKNAVAPLCWHPSSTRIIHK